MRSYKFLAAAAVALGIIAWLGPQFTWAEDMGGTVQHSDKDAGVHRTGEDMTKSGQLMTGQLSFPAGIQTKDLGEATDIRNALKVVTTRALDDGEYGDVVDRLVDADRDRINQFKLSDDDQTQLDNRIAEIERLWNAKYNQRFSIDEEKVFASVGILQGEIVDPSQLALHWPVPVTDKGMTAQGFDLQGQAQPAAGQINDPSQVKKDADKWFGGDTNLEKGRNVALVRLPDLNKMPGLTLSLIHEMPDIWRFDIPDNISGQQLYSNWRNHLDFLVQHQNEWPADVNQGYLMVTHHVAMALYGLDMQGKSIAGGDINLKSDDLKLDQK